MAVQPMARDWSLMQRQGPPFPVVPAPPPEVGRPPDDIGTGHCSWYPTCAFDQVLPVTADDVCIRWSQFEGTGVALQYAINRCDAPFFAGGAWGSTSSFGGDAYDSGGTLIMPGVISSKYPYEYVRLKLRMSQLGGPVEFELVGQGFGYYGGGDVTANRTMVGLFGVTFSHVIEQITNGDGYMRIKADPVAMTMRVRMWR
ncbi:MAG: hypothetical protein L6R48_08345 [Planctomycetes bacterium]|nr:hypothetical protein [Planctomycetota bacterium]